jgi:glutamate dehydrogenase (NAD(P)+)
VGRAPWRAPRPAQTGFGNMGGMAARLMAKAGYKIVAIVEYDGAVYNAAGLDIAALSAQPKETGSIVDFAGAENIDREEARFSKPTCCCRRPRRT